MKVNLVTSIFLKIEININTFCTFIYVYIISLLESMENWDEEKLKEVVEKKHGENERKLPKTDIVSNIFILLTCISIKVTIILKCHFMFYL